MYLNPERARRVMQEHSLDALVATLPQNVAYLTTHRTFGFTSFEAFGVFPRSPNAIPVLVVGHFGLVSLAAGPEWAGQVVTYEDTHFNAVMPSDPGAFEAPWRTSEQFDLRLERLRQNARSIATPDPIEALAQCLTFLNLEQGRIGFDDLNLADILTQRHQLKASPVDARWLLQDIRLVKTAAEVSLLREAVDVNEQAFTEALDRAQEGVATSQLARTFRVGLATRGATTPVGASGFGFAQLLHPVLERGSVVPCAAISVYNSYNTDVGRTIVVGPPSAAQARIHHAIETAFDDLDAAIGPGVATDDLFPLIEDSVRRSGAEPERLALYVHAIGLDSYDFGHHSRQSGFKLVPNVTFCVYVSYIAPEEGGAFFVEEEYLVTKSGCESLYGMPRGLIEVPTAASGIPASHHQPSRVRGTA